MCCRVIECTKLIRAAVFHGLSKRCGKFLRVETNLYSHTQREAKFLENFVFLNFAVQTKHVFCMTTFILIMCSLTHFNIKVWVGGFPFVICGKTTFGIGDHTSSHKMGLTYSRDGAAASLMALEQMLCEIKTGLFSPDETRSGRIRTQAEIAFLSVIEIKDEALESGQKSSDAVEVNEIEESSDSSSDSESEASDDYEPRGYDPKVFCAPRLQMVSFCGNTRRVVCFSSLDGRELL